MALQNLVVKIFVFMAIAMRIFAQSSPSDGDDYDDFSLVDIIAPHINETCMAECSQRAAAMQANLSTKYPQHEEEIAGFPSSAGFFSDFCSAHRQEEQCHSTCGNMSSVEFRLRQIVWSLPHLICDDEYQRLSDKLPCLIDAKKAANTTCVTACNTQRPAPGFVQSCRRYSCVFDCQKLAFDQKCGGNTSALVRRIRKHGWPTGCDDQ